MWNSGGATADRTMTFDSTNGLVLGGTMPVKAARFIRTTDIVLQQTVGGWMTDIRLDAYETTTDAIRKQWAIFVDGDSGELAVWTGFKGADAVITFRKELIAPSERYRIKSIAAQLNQSNSNVASVAVKLRRQSLSGQGFVDMATVTSTTTDWQAQTVALVAPYNVDTDRSTFRYEIMVEVTLTNGAAQYQSVGSVCREIAVTFGT
jgi:hypothetical protein